MLLLIIVSCLLKFKFFMVFLITYLSSLSFVGFFLCRVSGAHVLPSFQKIFFLTISCLTTKYDEHWRRLELWRKVLSTQKMEYAGREGLRLDGRRSMQVLLFLFPLLSPVDFHSILKFSHVIFVFFLFWNFTLILFSFCAILDVANSNSDWCYFQS